MPHASLYKSFRKEYADALAEARRSIDDLVHHADARVRAIVVIAPPDFIQEAAWIADATVAAMATRGASAPQVATVAVLGDGELGEGNLASWLAQHGAVRHAAIVMPHFLFPRFRRRARSTLRDYIRNGGSLEYILFPAEIPAVELEREVELLIKETAL